jgi:hypothetical protein
MSQKVNSNSKSAKTKKGKGVHGRRTSCRTAYEPPKQSDKSDSEDCNISKEERLVVSVTRRDDLSGSYGSKQLHTLSVNKLVYILIIDIQSSRLQRTLSSR